MVGKNTIKTIATKRSIECRINLSIYIHNIVIFRISPSQRGKKTFSFYSVHLNSDLEFVYVSFSSFVKHNISKEFNLDTMNLNIFKCFPIYK